MVRSCSKPFLKPRPWLARTLLLSMMFSSVVPCMAQTADSTAIVPAVPPVSPIEPPLAGFGMSGAAPRSGASGSSSSPFLQIHDKEGGGSATTSGALFQQQSAAMGDFVDTPNPLPRIPERNEFQDFITQAVGRELPIYGRNLFTGSRRSFAPSQNTAVPGDYVIGVGDQLHIRATGGIDIDYHATVDANGKISIPHIGSLNVAGTHFSDIQTAIKQHIGRLYRNFDLYVSMGQLRSIRVYLVGHVQYPGAYTVSSLSTLVNTLMAAGGPKSTGSLRSIQVKRAGKLIIDFDLYDLLLKGDKTKDIRLMPEDVVYVAPVGKLVALNGSVNQPAIYEMRDRDTLGDLLRFSGGVTPLASSEKISIERIVNRKQRTVKQFVWNTSTLKQPIFDGDLVSILDISRKFDHVVTVRGHVLRPIRLPWKDGMRIHDAIPSKDLLITQDYYRNMESLTRKSMQDVRAEKSINPEELQSITNLNKDLKSSKIKQTNLSAEAIQDDVQSADSTDIKRIIREPNFEYAVIERLKEDLTQEIISFNLGKALKDDSKNNLLLQPNDVITIFAKDDISVPRSQRSGFVRLEGEFISSGIYRVEPGETLRQVIERAGGLTQDAYLYAINLERKSARETQRTRYNEWLGRMEQDALRKAATQHALTAEDSAIQRNELENRKQLFEKLRLLQPKGRIVFNFKNKTDPRLSDLPDLVMEDGDKVVVPYKPSTVSVLGAVVNDGTFLYRPNKSVGDYLEEAGGNVEYADTNAVYVIRADGSIVTSYRKSSFFGLLVPANSIDVMPGDTVVLPEKIGGTNFWGALKDFSAIFYQFGLGAAAIKVLKN